MQNCNNTLSAIYFLGCKDDTCSNGGGSVDVLLKEGNVITSKNNKLELKMQADGNLVLYCRSIAIWSSNTDGHGAKFASFQKDGNLVIRQDNVIKYAANSYNKGGAELVVQNDANLVIYTNNGEAIWYSKTYGQCEGEPGCKDDTCSNGGGSVDVLLKEGNVITSKNNKLELKMQADGNLVLYCRSIAIWSSNTDGDAAKFASFQKDGNLVIRQDNFIKYAANSYNKGGAELVVQNDANLVIYTKNGEEIWSSKTSGQCEGEPGCKNDTCSNGGGSVDVLLKEGNVITSKNNKLELKMQADGNLVLYCRSIAIWSSNTDGDGAKFASFQKDGNLVIRQDNVIKYAANSYNKGGAELVVQNDANLVIYTKIGEAIWYSKTYGQCEGEPGCKDDTCSNGGGSVDVLLKEGNVITSKNNKLELKMQADGNLVLYCRSIAIWSSKSNGDGAKFASFQKDGNLVIRQDNVIKYAANSYNKGGAELVVRNDANLVIYTKNGEEIWSSKTSGQCEGEPGCKNDTCSNGGGSVDVLLKEGNVITSKNNKLELKMQADGNLVLYCRSIAIWSSNTDGDGAKFASFQKDGNLVIRQDNVIKYAANSYNKGGAELVVQNDANLVIYTKNGEAIWYSKTYGQCEGEPGCKDDTCSNGGGSVDVLLKEGNVITSKNNKLELKMQADGNLVLYCRSIAIWSSKSNGDGAKFASFQKDGNLVIRQDNVIKYAANSYNKGGAELVVRNDANLVIYTKNGEEIWSSKTSGQCEGEPGCKNDTCSNGGGSVDVLLKEGNVITSKNNKLELKMQADGNLVLYCRSIAIWSSNTDGDGAKFASFQKDGNLVIRQDNVIKYAANSYNKGGAELVVQNDANLVIYTKIGEAIWYSKTYGQCEGEPGCKDDTCSNGGGSVDVLLKEGNVITSKNNKLELKMQADGNLVLYCRSIAIWSSKSNGDGAKFASFQKDGNLVIRQDNVIKYAANSYNKGGAELVVQNDANLVIYTKNGEEIWSSKTSGQCEGEPGCKNDTCSNGGGSVDVLLKEGNVITSKNNKLELKMQADGNLVLYCRSIAIWSSNTDGDGAKFASFQKDGNLVIRQDNVIKYAANSYNKGGAELVVQNDANLVIYTKNGEAIWYSKTYGQCVGEPGCKDDTCSNGGGSVDVLLKEGNVITSKNNKLELKMQADGNLVLYCRIIAIWSSKSNGDGAKFASFQKDGNLVIRQDNVIKYAANSYNKGGAELVVQNDAKLVIYTKHGEEIWSSKTSGQCEG